MPELNSYGQPVGQSLLHWRPPARPRPEIVRGRRCCLRPLDPPRDAPGLFQAIGQSSDAARWTYLPEPPPGTEPEVLQWAERRTADPTAQFYAVVDSDDARILGALGYLRIDPPNGSLEIGWVIFGPDLQRTTAATEAVFLLLQRAFDLGYRRVEWKCDSLNAPSRRAADRFGFTFEGVFRQDVVVKGRNRDTAWYSLLDVEWPAVGQAFAVWLNEENFDATGSQRQSLSELVREARGHRA